MEKLKSKNYRTSRIKNKVRWTLAKIFHMGILVVIGEYLLLNIISFSLSERYPLFDYKNVPSQIVNFAISEKPILRVAQAYESLSKNRDFDMIIQRQFPTQVKGQRLQFRTLDLQDKEGAKVGYVVKF